MSFNFCKNQTDKKFRDALYRDNGMGTILNLWRPGDNQVEGIISRLKSEKIDARDLSFSPSKYIYAQLPLPSALSLRLDLGTAVVENNGGCFGHFMLPLLCLLELDGVDWAHDKLEIEYSMKWTSELLLLTSSDGGGYYGNRELVEVGVDKEFEYLQKICRDRVEYEKLRSLANVSVVASNSSKVL